ncbi:MAG: hypothetical protein CVV21_00170 [Candidatus Goldiibacteriota bacterium HGW-Goldbacteria-1]|jgi:PAS domain-containing protein|nr:MAG: hypothetical protein CVV21_00170 [Candidatus Goldiibacteriota bacterium HGW-Goldbacteria-1]
MEDRLKQNKRSITYIRAVLTLIIILLGIYNFGGIIESSGFLFFYIAVVIISNIFFGLLPEKMYEGMKLHYIIFVLDIILVSFGAYWLAGLTFNMLMVIFLALFMAAIGQSVGLSVAIAAVTTLVYFFIRSSGNDAGFAGFMQEREILNIPFIFVVSLHASFLAEKANEEIEEKKKMKKAYGELSEKLKDSHEDLEGMLEFHTRVYDSLKSGFIIMDASGIIKVFNARAEEIFALRGHKARNMHFKHLEAIGDAAELINNLILKRQPSEKVSVSIQAAGIIKKLLVSTYHVKDRENNITGYICSVEQVF